MSRIYRYEISVRRAATVGRITQGVDSDELNAAHYRHHLALAEGAEATVVVLCQPTAANILPARI